MEALSFAYWLQGFAELNENPPTVEQWQSIKEHLATVFNKVTPEVKKEGDVLYTLLENPNFAQNHIVHYERLGKVIC